MKRRTLFNWAILGWVVLMTGVSVPTGPAAGGDRASAGEQEWDRIVKAAMKKSSTPGAALAVIAGSEIRFENYGWADRANRIPVRETTLFQAGSISKTLTAWGVMKLAEEGKIDLNAPVERYLKRWHLPDSPYDRKQVTVRRLLSHTAGLSLRGYAGVRPGRGLASLEESLSGKTGGAGDVRLIRAPGTAFRYSGGGYTLLQLMIEEVSGMPFGLYMKDKILIPLGMNSSFFEWKNDFGADLSKGYGVLGQELPNYLFTEKAAAGLFTTSKDLAHFVTAHYQTDIGQIKGRGVLKPETVDRMHTMAEPYGWGLGYSVLTFSDNQKAIGHSGANRGWRSQFFIFPQKYRGLVILTNSDYGSYVVREAAACWMKEQTAFLPKHYLAAKRIEFLYLIGAGLLALLDAWLLAVGLHGLVKSKRSFAPFKALPFYKKSLRILFPLSLLSAWWIGLYGPIIHGWNIVEFLPINFKWVTCAYSLFCGVLFFLGLIPREKTQK
ncbi:MAG: class A beta-lactamase-related serine hydrolase [Desulfobacteraceae bacterium]|nr:MAG: class A beta-lactamase-related serine hydrolase [Desulfobacteraceae bacterium]